MGLPAAIKAHANGDVSEAATHYKRAYEQKDFRPVLFQNYGAILREQGDLDNARKLYKHGLRLFPDHRGIRLNYANLVRPSNPVLSFTIHLSLLQEKILTNTKDVIASDILPVAEILESLQLYHWSYQIGRWALVSIEHHPALLLLIFKLLSNSQVDLVTSAEKNYIQSLLEARVSSLPDLQQAEFYYALLALQLRRQEFDACLGTLSKARQLLSSKSIQSTDDLQKASKLNNVNSWNVACTLLTHQYFEEGWKLFEFGLRATAHGPQKWQRALPKPFTSDQCPVWRGEPLVAKSLLLLEEQAIGDVMQFLTLLPNLLDEAEKIYLLLSNRLVPVYRRSFSDDINNREFVMLLLMISLWKNLSEFFDFQSPIGSVCQYRFTDIRQYEVVCRF